MKDAMGKIYHWFLWCAGAALTDEELEELKGGGDRFTFWFRRSKKRLGGFWWVCVVATLILHTIILYDNIRKKRWWQVIIGFAGWVLIIWLIPHILGYTILF